VSRGEKGVGSRNAISTPDPFSGPIKVVIAATWMLYASHDGIFRLRMCISKGMVPLTITHQWSARALSVLIVFLYPSIPLIHFAG